MDAFFHIPRRCWQFPSEIQRPRWNVIRESLGARRAKISTRGNPSPRVKSYTSKRFLRKLPSPSEVIAIRIRFRPPIIPGQEPPKSKGVLEGKRDNSLSEEGEKGRAAPFRDPRDASENLAAISRHRSEDVRRPSSVLCPASVDQGEGAGSEGRNRCRMIAIQGMCIIKGLS